MMAPTSLIHRSFHWQKTKRKKKRTPTLRNFMLNSFSIFPLTVKWSFERTSFILHDFKHWEKSNLNGANLFLFFSTSMICTSTKLCTKKKTKNAKRKSVHHFRPMKWLAAAVLLWFFMRINFAAQRRMDAFASCMNSCLTKKTKSFCSDFQGMISSLRKRSEWENFEQFVFCFSLNVHQSISHIQTKISNKRNDN